MSPLMIAVVGVAASTVLLAWSSILRRRRTRRRLLRWAATLGLPDVANEGTAALRVRVLAETSRQEAQLAKARQQRAVEESRCLQCGGYLMYSARQRGDGLCGPCSRLAAGKPTAGDRARARWGSK